ncbi:enoyl-CoA hydratase/isomerase family protein [Rhodospirillum centenum]|uniref:Enoyl-CoA hydratase n=1 Tax=Rhodospirillum centenum (strain ATCC 51521 / SW) TaxID=414684 RepID=B6IQT9_RHOCS|nr:enoyl-CoA hydratase/isomerase family protein [Rhodospirillum centenum]ACI97825.1 enoyl-CoA hydratase [Rhodospirillum centenum SW]
MPDVLSHTRADGVATVTLNRPEVHNAFNDAVIGELTAVFRRLGGDPAVRAVLLRGNGPSFSAGGDLAWMRRMAGYGPEENRRDALALAEMLRTLNELPKPTVAVVHGNAFAGAVGLVSCCDVALAADSVQFALTEVRLGLIPATIAPYVIAALGARACRRYFLTAERFSALEAHRLGLVHEVVPAHILDAAVEKLVSRLLEGGPRALAESKRLIREVAGRPVDDALMADTAERIAAARASEEGREGVAGFLEKRPPAWKPG